MSETFHDEVRRLVVEIKLRGFEVYTPENWLDHPEPDRKHKRNQLISVLENFRNNAPLVYFLGLQLLRDHQWTGRSRLWSEP